MKVGAGYTGPAIDWPAAVIDAFHRLYYHSLLWDANTFLGYQVKQCPFDLHTYQELIARERPASILQTGVAGGGSVLYFAALLDLCGAPPDAVVVGIDLTLTDAARRLRHPRIRLVEGDSADPRVAAVARSHIPAAGALVVLDSDHTARHVGRELDLYRDCVSIGGCLVVEDTNINGQPVCEGFGPGPFEAVEAFLRADPRFVRDDAIWRRTLFSFHQHGWLRRVR